MQVTEVEVFSRSFCEVVLQLVVDELDDYLWVVVDIGAVFGFV